MKLDNITFNIEAFRGMSKEEFMSGNHCQHLDPERTWKRIQKELSDPEVTEVNKTESDVPKPEKQSRRNRKGN